MRIHEKTKRRTPRSLAAVMLSAGALMLPLIAHAILDAGPAERGVTKVERVGAAHAAKQRLAAGFTRFSGAALHSDRVGALVGDQRGSGLIPGSPPTSSPISPPRPATPRHFQPLDYIELEYVPLE